MTGSDKQKPADAPPQEPTPILNKQSSASNVQSEDRSDLTAAPSIAASQPVKEGIGNLALRPRSKLPCHDAESGSPIDGDSEDATGLPEVDSEAATLDVPPSPVLMTPSMEQERQAVGGKARQQSSSPKPDDGTPLQTIQVGASGHVSAARPPFESLDMLHERFIRFNSHGKAFTAMIGPIQAARVDRDTTVYKKGGKVLRITLSSGWHTDVMICATNVCSECHPNARISPTSPEFAPRMPFVHHRTLDISEGASVGKLIFKGHRCSADDFKWMKASQAVEFMTLDGPVVCEAAVCDPQICEECKATDAELLWYDNSFELQSTVATPQLKRQDCMPAKDPQDCLYAKYMLTAGPSYSPFKEKSDPFSPPSSIWDTSKEYALQRAMNRLPLEVALVQHRSSVSASSTTNVQMSFLSPTSPIYNPTGAAYIPTKPACSPLSTEPSDLSSTPFSKAELGGFRKPSSVASKDEVRPSWVRRPFKQNNHAPGHTFTHLAGTNGLKGLHVGSLSSMAASRGTKRQGSADLGDDTVDGNAMKKRKGDGRGT